MARPEAIGAAVRRAWAVVLCRLAQGPHTLLPLLLALAPLLMGASEPIVGSFAGPARYVIALLVLLIITLTVNTTPSVGLVMTIVFLAMMGAIRRALIPFLDYESNDPLTLVSTLAVAILFARLLQQGRIPRDTPIARLMVPLMIIMALEVFNPLQGGIVVGLAGAIFYLGPVCWYFVGRAVGQRKMLSGIGTVLIVLAVVAGLYGMYQTYFGFLPAEKIWMSRSGYRQLLEEGRYRVFSTYLSFGEYVLCATMGAILCWVRVIERRYIYLLPLIFLMGVIFFSSSRGGTLMTLFAIVVVWAVQGRTYRVWLPRLLIALVLGTYGLLFGLRQAKEVNFSRETSKYVEHNVDGILDPFGAKSTGDKHAELISGGFMAGIKNPVGQGLGITSGASRKFGGQVASTEMDVSNVFLTCGAFGGLLYVGLFVAVWWMLGRYWHETRDPLALAVIGLCAVGAGNWLTGGYYMPSTTIWICVGILDRFSSQYWKSNPRRQMPRWITRRRTGAPTTAPVEKPAAAAAV